MTNCESCDEDVDLPFICSYCKKSFCIDHRLPESHNCSNLIFARSPTYTKEESGSQIRLCLSVSESNGEGGPSIRPWPLLLDADDR